VTELSSDALSVPERWDSILAPLTSHMGCGGPHPATISSSFSFLILGLL
jgi:hypothetical protein